jgi:peptidoglycan/xylan/chitin deacetylase (PgdA/CDA1 family)
VRAGRSGAVTLLGGLLTVAALAVPAFAYVHFSEPDTVLDRHEAPNPSLSADELRALVDIGGDRAGQQPPLILSYHDVAPDPEPRHKYTVTPQQLTDHLAMLRAAGYESISSQQLVDWLDGTGDLPERPVMLTFDDGTSGLWSYADDVLEEQGFNAVVFVISSRIGQNRPYYLTSDEIDRLVATGRWEVQSHTRDGHERIPVDADGTEHPFLISRAWLADEERVETRPEFEARVADDLAGSIADIEHWFTSDARLFAYPFSAEVEVTDDPDATATSSELVAQAFDASMTNVLPDRLVSDRDRRDRVLPRLEVFRATSTADLFTRISNAVPTAATTSSPLADPASWTDRSGEPLAGVATDDVDQGSEVAEAAAFDTARGRLTLTAPDDGFLPVYHQPGRSTDWVDYRIRTLVSGLGVRPGGPTGSVFALLGSEEQVQVSVSSTFVRVGIGDVPSQQEIVAEQPLEADDSRTVAVEVTADTLVVLVDGVEITRLPLPGESTGGIGVAANRGAVEFSAMRLEAGERAPSAPNPTSGFEVTSGEWRGEGSIATTSSPVFRARSLSSHGNAIVDLRFRIREYSETSTDHEWDGVHLGLRYTSPDDLYYVSVARRDGTIAIKRKAGGVYETLAVGELPLGVGEWHEATVTVTGTEDGVTLVLSVDGTTVLTHTDTELPLVEPGRVAVRSDNVDVEFSDLTIRDL